MSEQYKEIKIDRHDDGTATLTKDTTTIIYLGKGAMDRTWNFKEINGSIAGLSEYEAFEKAFEIVIKHPAFIAEEPNPETVINRTAENKKVEVKIIESEQQEERGDELKREDTKNVPVGEHPEELEEAGDNTTLENQKYEEDAKEENEDVKSGKDIDSGKAGKTLSKK